ncbi:CD9 antigen-like isoform X2 [Ornithodoros turicata]|uniref:CD9 antigen-like isoform X2 n=1 Tax=Ornithodoros turicata TaxID=34597 RepID=UPI00313A3784
MALKGCYACLKYTVVILNLLFWLAGIAVVVVSVMLLLDSTKYLANEGKDSYLYLSAIYILLGAGGLMALVGFLGCCGALRESPCMLGTFFIFLLVIIAAEITGGIWVWMNLAEFEKSVKTQVQHMIQKDYNSSEVITKTVDALQHDLRCCGIDGPQDWSSAKFNQKEGGLHLLEAGIRSLTGAYKVPESCCVQEAPKAACELSRQFGGTSILTGLHSQGCATALWNGLNNNLVLVCSIGLAISVLQILGLIFTMVLCCAVRRDGGSSFKA